jgi:hypothetical protein
MELEEEAAGIAQHGADLVSPPQRSGGGGAILAGGLGDIAIRVSSHGGHDGGWRRRKNDEEGGIGYRGKWAIRRENLRNSWCFDALSPIDWLRQTFCVRGGCGCPYDLGAESQRDDLQRIEGIMDA